MHERHVNTAIKLVTGGVNVSVGSHGTTGSDLHRAVWDYVDGGLDATSSLRLATIEGAKKLGLSEELGSIEESKLADFIVLRCDPLDDIRCTADIEYVVKGGVVYHSETMTQMWPEYKPIPKPWWHSDEDWEELKSEVPEPWEGVPIADGVELEQPTMH